MGLRIRRAAVWLWDTLTWTVESSTERYVRLIAKVDEDE